MAYDERAVELPPMSANANNIPNDSIDCGIIRFNWCRGPACQKYAKLRVFVAVLAYVALLQGAAETYFRISAKQAAVQLNYNAIIVDWLVVSSGIFAAVFALAFAYWAHRRHLVRWLGGVFMLQAAMAVIAVIPSIINFSGSLANTVIPPPGTHLCDNTTTIGNIHASPRSLAQQQTSTVTLVLMFLLQFAIGMGTLAFYTIAIIYIDDNSPSMDSPAVIACILTAKLFGLQLGSLLVVSVEDTTLGWWLGWLIIAPLVFMGGFLLALFPRVMPTTVIHQAAQRIMEETHQLGGQFSDFLEDTAFMPSMKRLFNNKLLMFNIVSMMFIEAASVNYLLQQETYLQSRFFLPYDEQDGLSQEWQSKLISYFLQPPVAGIAMLVGGLIISKIAPTARTIAGINIVQGVLLMGAYIGYTFLSCELGPMAGISAGKIQQPYCSRQCICSPNTFLPVCPENTTVTYYSPCYAGCTSKTKINSVEFYEGCTCDSDFGANGWTNVRATLGPCNSSQCLSQLVSFQVVSVFAAGVLGMITISKLILLLRSVLPQDKALALAMQIMFIGLFTYIPTHLAYQCVTRFTCLYWAPSFSRCLLRENPKHGNILDLLSAALIFMGIIFDVLVFWYAKHLNVYNCKVIDENYTPSLYAAPSTRRSGPSSLSPGSGSVATNTIAVSPKQSLATEDRPTAINNDITVFRNPSSITSASAEGTSVPPITENSEVKYAEVVFPPDKRKTVDGATSPKRMAVRADVPLHHLSAQDVRAQLSQLKSFTPKEIDDADEESTEVQPLMPSTNAATVKYAEMFFPPNKNPNIVTSPHRHEANNGTVTYADVVFPLNEAKPMAKSLHSNSAADESAESQPPMASTSAATRIGPTRPLSPETDL